MVAKFLWRKNALVWSLIIAPGKHPEKCFFGIFGFENGLIHFPQSKTLDDHALDDAALESLFRVYKIGLGETYPKAFLNAYYCTNHI